MSDKIIKAHKTRLLPAEKRKPLREPRKTDDIEDSAAFEAEIRERENRDISYQAAYDEVVEAAQQEVALVLKDAREQAREITEGAGAKAEKEREAAHRDGLEKGLGIGFAEGAERAEKALEDLLREGQDEVDRALHEAYATRDALLNDMEPKVLRLALDIAEKVLGYALDQNDEAFLSLVTAALDTIKCESRVTLRVNAEQHISAFRSKAEARLKTAQGSVEADIVTDMGVEPNGCLIETGSGMIDASVDSQLEQIARNMGIE